MDDNNCRVGTVFGQCLFEAFISDTDSTGSNGAVVYVASQLYGPLEVTSFSGAVLAGLVIGLVNYALSTLVED